MASSASAPTQPQADQLQQLREAQQALDPAALLEADDARLSEGLGRIKKLLEQHRWAAPSHAQAVVGFLVYFLQRVLPAALAIEGGRAFSARPWVDAFLGPSSTCPRWCVLVALSEALAGAATYDASWATARSPADEQADQERRRREAALVALSESQPALKFVVERIEGFLAVTEEGEDKEKGVLTAMVAELVDSKDAAALDCVLQALALLPVRLANALRGAVPPHLAGPALFETSARQVLRQLLRHQGEGEPWPELWGALVHKACKMGQAEVVARAWLEEAALLQREGDASGQRAACQALVEAVPLPSLEPFVLAFVRLLAARARGGKGTTATKTLSLDEAQAVLDRGFGAALAGGAAAGALRSILVNKLLLAASSTARKLPLAAARLVVRLLIAAGPAAAGAADLLRSLLSVWKERHFIQGADMPQQEFLTAAIVAALGAADKAALESAPGLVAFLLEGVGAHLESALEAVRLQGMRVGERFAQAMGQELRFDELDGRRDLWADEKEGEAEATVAAGGAGPEGEKEGEEDREGEEEEEDDELQPYDLSDDEADLAPVAAPRYLRRLIELLRVKDEQDSFDKQSAALREAEALVRARPADLPDLCCVLARDLLTLENRFGMEDFAALRQGALVALLATAPDRVAPMLAQLAFDTTLAYGARLEVLDLLMEGAQDLSGVKPKVATPAARAATPALLDETGPRVQGKRGLVTPVEKSKPEDKEEPAAALTASRAEARTRRWGYRRGQAPKAVRNLFGPVASRAFFRPLLNELLRSARASSDDAAPRGGLLDAAVADRSGLALLGSPSDAGLQPRLWVKDSDQALSLAKTLHALIVFVECSGHSPGTARLAEELLGLAWPLRESPFPELRRAVLLAVAGALAHVQVEQFLARGGGSGAAALQAVTAWTTAMGELDADPTNRQLARAMVAEQPRELAALGLYTLLASSA